MIVKAVKYGATWCAPCRITETNLKSVGIPFESVDVDECEDIAKEKNIKSIPVVEFYDETNNVIKTHVGLLTIDAIKNILDESGNRCDIKRI